jgi:hypothetical protein
MRKMRMKRKNRKRPNTPAEDAELSRLIRNQAEDDRRSRIDVTAGMEIVLGLPPGRARQLGRGGDKSYAREFVGKGKRVSTTFSED